MAVDMTPCCKFVMMVELNQALLTFPSSTYLFHVSDGIGFYLHRPLGDSVGLPGNLKNDF